MKYIYLLMLTAFHAATSTDAFMEADELPNGGKIWVLLVAGSRGYYNYRHQADICHAYHVSKAFSIILVTYSLTKIPIFARLFPTTVSQMKTSSS